MPPKVVSVNSEPHVRRRGGVVIGDEAALDDVAIPDQTGATLGHVGLERTHDQADQVVVPPGVEVPDATEKPIGAPADGLHELGDLRELGERFRTAVVPSTQVVQDRVAIDPQAFSALPLSHTHERVAQLTIGTDFGHGLDRVPSLAAHVTIVERNDVGVRAEEVVPPTEHAFVDPDRLRLRSPVDIPAELGVAVQRRPQGRAVPVADRSNLIELVGVAIGTVSLSEFCPGHVEPAGECEQKTHLRVDQRRTIHPILLEVGVENRPRKIS